jgi:hypothetical protein
MITTENSVEQIRKAIENIPPKPIFEGRGIVMVAGGEKYLTNAYCSIRLLRHFGCQLPIQIWYLNKKEEIPEIFEELAKLNCTFINAQEFNKKLEKPHTNLNGWECKPFAIIHSIWKEVLFLDCDVFVDGDPEYGFEVEGFKKYGSYFMPDYSRLTEEREIWSLTGIAYRDEPEIESGVIYIDKEKCWKPLNITNFLCEWGTMFYFNYVHGDKCCFQMAWHIMFYPYYMEPTPIRSLSATMVQHLNGKSFFYHRNMSKLSLKENRKIKEFKNEELLFKYLEDLRVIYKPYTALSLGESFSYYRLGKDRRKIKLFNGKIEGGGSLESTYKITDNKLTIFDNSGNESIKLEKCGLGWIGKWLKFEKFVVLLLNEGE